jgi:dTDP-4-dehydrorhamnose 3,5-epimerase
MIFKETILAGAFIIEPERHDDHRGFFARIWCKNELQQHGLKDNLAQANVGFSYRKGTLRGLHYQKVPHAEVKIVRCTRGAIFDVIVDLRPESLSYRQWFGAYLDEENRKMIYVPEGFAQGYITMADNTEMYYLTSEFYHPDSASGIRYDDPQFGIVWPTEVIVISDQDRHWPDFYNGA